MNAFDALGIPPTLVLTDTGIEAAWREAGKKHHPDAGGAEADFRAAGEARNILASPSSRLAHWLELHGHAPDPRGAVAGEVMDLFSAVGDVVRRAAGLARRREAATTALGLAVLESETLHLRADIESAIRRVDAAITARCRPFSQWQDDPSQAVRDQADATVRNLRFLEKWRRDLMAAYASLA